MAPTSLVLVSLSTHPLTLTSLQLLHLAFLISYTTPSSSLRPSLLPFIATLSWHVIHSCPARLPSRFWRGILAGYSTGFVLQSVDLALLGSSTLHRDPRTAEAPSPSTPLSPNTVAQRVCSGLATALDSRRSGSPWEVKGVPLFSRQKPSYVPARGTFLRREAFRLVAVYLVLDAMAWQAPSAEGPGLYPVHQVPLLTRLREVTVGEVGARVGFTLGVWTSICCIIQLLYSAAAVVSVASGLSEPRRWRPVFGDWREAVTLRRFWGYVLIAVDALLVVLSSLLFLPRSCCWPLPSNSYPH